MQRGHLPLGGLVCLPLVSPVCSVSPNYKRPEVRVPSAYPESLPASFKEAVGKPPADGVVDTMIKAFDRLAKRVSRRRGGSPAPHPSPVEAA